MALGTLDDIGLTGVVPLPVLLTTPTLFTETQPFDPFTDPALWPTDMEKNFRYDPETQIAVSVDGMGNTTTASFPTCHRLTDTTCCAYSCGVDLKVMDRISDSVGPD
jgi:hypothetical protein